MLITGTITGRVRVFRITAIGAGSVRVVHLTHVQGGMVHLTLVHGRMVHLLTLAHIAGKCLQRQAGNRQGQQEGQNFSGRVTHS